MSDIGKIIKEKGITQAEFGASIGVGQAVVYQWVSGKTVISPEMALEIERVYGVDAEKLSSRLSSLVALIKARKRKRAVRNIMKVECVK